MKTIFNKEKLCEMITEFHNVTGIRISFLEDFQKPIIGFPLDNCELCRKKQTDKSFYDKCVECDRKAFENAKNSKDFYIYKCHYNMIEAIQPVWYDSQLLGYFLLGQIVTDKDDFIKQNNPSAEELKLLDKIKPISNDVLYSCAKILNWLANYCVLNNDITSSHKESFDDIEKWLNEHFAEKITIDFLCQKFHYSRSALFAVFKNELNQGVLEHINLIRLEKSKTLLLNHSINDVAYMVGFNDNNYFSRIFKKTYGISPSTYLKKYSHTNYTNNPTN